MARGFSASDWIAHHARNSPRAVACRDLASGRVHLRAIPREDLAARECAHDPPRYPSRRSAPRKVFESFVAHVGMLYARRRGAFQRYHDTVYERFWRRELDVDSVAEISQVLRSIGVGPEESPASVDGAGRLEHDRIMDEAHALGLS